MRVMIVVVSVITEQIVKDINFGRYLEETIKLSQSKINEIIRSCRVFIYSSQTVFYYKKL